MKLPENHPRKKSLEIRHKLTDGFKRGLVAEAGLIAHGRGEAYDYLLGEKTCKHAETAISHAAAIIALAERPVISVNGNTSALVATDMIELEGKGLELEVNLFYYNKDRMNNIIQHLKQKGATQVFGQDRENQVPDLDSSRGQVDDALYNADVILVMLEDGDRTEMMKKMGKKIINIDLNPMSRSAKMADITIVDNVVRALPLLSKKLDEMKNKPKEKLQDIIKSFNQEENLAEMEKIIRKG